MQREAQPLAESLAERLKKVQFSMGGVSKDDSNP
jgi:hypothetical protein